MRVAGFLKLMAIALSLASWPARSSWADGIAVEPVTFPTPFFEAPGPGETVYRLDNVLEASGVEPIGDGRLLLVAHDKKVPLRVIETATGRQVGPLLTCAKFPAETPKSSKWEGIARDSEGNYYLVGSYSGKTPGERDEHAKLIRFRLKTQPGTNGGLDAVAIDEGSVISWRLASPLIQALQHEGLDAKAVDQRKIEGLAIRELPAGPDGRVRRKLVIGLRQPDDLVRTFVADITVPPAPDAELALARLFAFDPGEREGVCSQLTSLEYLAVWKGFLVITATEDDQNAFHGNTLWFVPDDRIAQGNSSPILADKVWTFEAAMKAEGLCVLPQAGVTDPGTVRLVVTYDNDPHATHIPSRFQQINLIRRPAATLAP
ncbi:MAG: hypothetical protein JO344_08355 [Planctomycetaceae bacterium]|nr:hypothetical protein [Planctomycetaceae bacterium]